MISSPFSQFEVRQIALSELYALCLAGTLGNAAKFDHYMAFLLIVPDKTTEGEKAFGLVAVWAHPLQAHHPSLGEAACKLRLLISTSNHWVYAFTQLIEGALHMPLSSEGHISVMIDGAPSANASGCLSQLEVCKLLQCGDQVVCPKGLNGELELMQFSFPEPALN